MSRMTFIHTLIVLVACLGTQSLRGDGKPALDDRYSVSIDYTRDSFSDDLDPWELLSIGLGHNFDFGSVILRGNYAERFHQKGAQFEVDSYPSLGKGRYAYFNIGYSDASIFPKYRLGMELYQAIGYGYETSLGFRKLWFASSSSTAWTLSLAKYIGSFYISVRPYYTPKPSGDSWSGSIEVRKYLDDWTYFLIKGGQGISGDQRASSSETFYLRSSWISIGTHWRLRPGTSVTGSMSVEKMEPRPEVERQQTTFSLGIEQDF